MLLFVCAVAMVHCTHKPLIGTLYLYRNSNCRISYYTLTHKRFVFCTCTRDQYSTTAAYLVKTMHFLAAYE